MSLPELMRPFLLSLALVGALAQAAEPPISNSSGEETKARIARIPADRAWWKVNGEQLHWSHLNVPRFLATVPVPRAGPVRELEKALEPRIGEFPVTARGSFMPFREFLDSGNSTTTAVVILHHGRIVFEHYPRQEPWERPIFWSVTKVLATTLVRLLEERGEVDPGMPIDHYIPELAESAFAGVTVRNLLDMATGVNCGDEYENADSCYFRYAASIGDAYYNDASADNPRTFLAGLKVGKHAEQGTVFNYSGVNSFILSWLVETITGMPYQDVVSREIWAHIGAEADAAFMAPRNGVPNAHGGFLAMPRDMARFGLLFTPSYAVVSDERIISEAYLDFLWIGGRPQLMTAAGWDLRASGVRHSVNEWTMFENHDMYKSGWGGQGLLVNPELDLVVVWAGFLDEQDQHDRLIRAIRQVLGGVYSASR